MRFSHLILAGALLGAGCASALAAAQQSSTPVAPSASAAERALARAVAQAVPGRNLYQLTEQLKMHPPRPISPVVRTSSPNYPVGHQDTFNVLSEDTDRYFKVTATIRAETPHLYLYVQNGVKVSTAAVEAAARRFEQHTYPTDRKYFGSEWIPGIDGDPHITCLVGDLLSAAALGYFSAEDEYPRSVNPYSNQREMFYINAADTTPGARDFDVTLAHEFQHMIHWHMHRHENLWLNEGSSMLAEWLNGYNPTAEADAFLVQPGTQLDAWDPNDDLPNYGASYLFLSYLLDRFGARFERTLLADGRVTDIPLIDDVLRRLGTGLTSRQVFAQWAAANYIDDPSLAHGLYGYRQLVQRVQPQHGKTVPFTVSDTIPPYTADYVTITPGAHPAPFHLRFSALPMVPVVGISRKPPFWWSNRGDMMQTSLSRTVDVRKAVRPRLTYQAWWDIEKDYDYAYVEASRDGGKTYVTLRGTDTTRSNPNGASYGNGYTGWNSGWHNESIDLSAFAGHQIKLRFQYVTDDGVNGQGLVMKDLAIPAIGWHDDFTGWQQHGFLPITANALPSDWTVELVSYTSHGVTVSRLPLSSAQQGSMLIDPAKAGLTKLVAIVFTTAPKTTVRTPFTLSAAAG
ncbi:MAG TPA: hypothetical protein VKX16_07315 [Chloroflexota bacterium]|nr:hypothetical protein [Chloroflexota bacterium]